MASKLMDTEAGGEQTQYEGATTENVPPKRSGGQFGAPETTENIQSTAAQGEKTAEKIRYGQGISEQGMGGMTTVQKDGATQDGFGQVEDREAEGTGAKESRRAAGYGGGEDIDRNVGA